MAKIALAQFTGHIDKQANVRKAVQMGRQAAANGAQIVCFPELANTIYFCTERNPAYFEWAEPVPGPSFDAMAALARETGMVVIYPLFEHAPEDDYYNTALVIGPDGDLIGKYRKSSIPLMDASAGSPTSYEKYYFKPGNLGFPVFPTPLGLNLGILICYDRHFPEGARALGLGGAHVVFIPTASSRAFFLSVWEIELQAHAIANVYYACGLNKVGRDVGGSDRFHYGSSFVADPFGRVISRGSATEDDIVYAEVDLKAIEEAKKISTFYRDRRPDVYGALVEPVRVGA